MGHTSILALVGLGGGGLLWKTDPSFLTPKIWGTSAETWKCNKMLQNWEEQLRVAPYWHQIWIFLHCGSHPDPMDDYLGFLQRRKDRGNGQANLVNMFEGRPLTKYNILCPL